MLAAEGSRASTPGTKGAAGRCRCRHTATDLTVIPPTGRAQPCTAFCAIGCVLSLGVARSTLAADAVVTRVVTVYRALQADGHAWMRTLSLFYDSFFCPYALTHSAVAAVCPARFSYEAFFRASIGSTRRRRATPTSCAFQVILSVVHEPI
eukprot:354068-Chlamydomonas_euryale.AAC.6